MARHFSLSTTRFLGKGKNKDLGVAVTFTATYLGNSAVKDLPLFCLSTIPPERAANQGVNIVILP